ncbi:hypothetical protein GCM10022297_16320 [Lactobacillus hamsteri]|uniref:Uncharacterized protein n=1 Tax=Lactobacillus hamsteri DSM 5661 = JCM 6256 TaxID=1423754 RepID=A0A0R1YCM3_9LACO|nr:hypothetical protein [Lactobacillus hamsteri]KRM37481.1 hypothetical protein FC39_GL000130 [Lactobacillus hamsteri DSM 5661 = JCM 6256]
MSKKKILFTIGSIVAGLAAAAVTKKAMDNQPVDTDEENEDRGVSPVRIYEDEKPVEEEKVDEVPDLKADAINRPYKPVEY